MNRNMAGSMMVTARFEASFHHDWLSLERPAIGKATGTASGNLVGVRGSFTQFSVRLVSVVRIRKAPIAGHS